LTIPRLLEEVEKACQDPRYEKLREGWRRFSSMEERFIPVTVSMTNVFYIQPTSISLLEYHSKPEKMVEFQLQAKLLRHREIRDNSILTVGVGVDFGNALEASILGVQPVFRADTDPWPGRSEEDPVVKDEGDLDRLRDWDFYGSGVMPQVHRFYEAMKRVVDGKVDVGFPGCWRGLWGLANDLRGTRNLILDTYRNPSLVHKVMEFVTEYRMWFEGERAKFLGEPLPKSGGLGNDEVSALVISPRIYGEFIYPYERRLAEFYEEGISNYHSCGNLTPFLDKIAGLKGVKYLHVSPWTDFKTAIEKFKGRKVVFYKRMHPVADVLTRTPEDMAKILEYTLEVGGDAAMHIDAGAFQTGPLEKIKEWVNVARETLKDRGFNS